MSLAPGAPRMLTLARLAGRRPAGPPLLLSILAIAVAARVLAGGRTPAASTPAALLFAAILAATALASGWRPGRLRLGNAARGAAVGAALVLIAALRTPLAAHGIGIGLDLRFAAWAPAVVTVAVAEEWLLRGALHDALRAQGDLTAVLVGAAGFALLHLPLYGVGALPLDLAVGVTLGGLRVLTGGVGAPATAHAAADLATWVMW